MRKAYRDIGTAVIDEDGWGTYNIWDHSSSVRDLYARRARNEANEMDCAAQAAELLKVLVNDGESILDVGCGSGYFFHSLKSRDMKLEYYGIDATENFIDLGRRELKSFGLNPENLQSLRIEDFRGEVDHVLCMNVLSNLDNFHRPLERMLIAARRSVVIRESIRDGSSYTYVTDEYLDAGTDLKVHVNTYDREEIASFIRAYGFTCREVVDNRVGGGAELVIGHPHYWTFLVATRD